VAEVIDSMANFDSSVNSVKEVDLFVDVHPRTLKRNGPSTIEIVDFTSIDALRNTLTLAIPGRESEQICYYPPGRGKVPSLTTSDVHVIRANTSFTPPKKPQLGVVVKSEGKFPPFVGSDS
jgi:hypothetical protein